MHKSFIFSSFFIFEMLINYDIINIMMDIQKFFPFLNKNYTESIDHKQVIKKDEKNYVIPESFYGKIPSSRFQLQVLENPESLSPKKKELYDVAVEFQSLFIKIMLNSMRKSLNKENDILYGGNAQEIFEDMLYDEYAKLYSKHANLPLAKEIYLQLQEFIKEDSEEQSISNIKNIITNQKQYLKQMEGILSTEQIHQEWYK